MSRVDPARFAPEAAPYREGGHDWLDELVAVVRPAPPRHRMGVRAVEERAWLLPDGHRASELALRARLLREARDEVVAELPGSEAATVATAGSVHAWLDRHPPDGHPPDGHPPDGHPPDRHEPRPVPDRSALVRAASAVQEDLCVLQRDGEGCWRLVAAVVCFPTYWRLVDKIGTTEPQIHAPVVGFDADLGGRVSRFFDGLRPERVIARRNWGFSPHALLFLPDLTAVAAPERFDPESAWLRSERQTLRRLPRGDVVVFTIRVQLAPLTALGTRPALATALHDTIRSWPAELIAGRGNPASWTEALCRWLDATGRRGAGTEH